MHWNRKKLNLKIDEKYVLMFLVSFFSLMCDNNEVTTFFCNSCISIICILIFVRYKIWFPWDTERDNVKITFLCFLLQGRIITWMWKSSVGYIVDRGWYIPGKIWSEAGQCYTGRRETHAAVSFWFKIYKYTKEVQNSPLFIRQIYHWGIGHLWSFVSNQQYSVLGYCIFQLVS